MDRPLEELILDLTRPTLIESEGKRRARAEATLIYQPADSGFRDVESDPFIFNAPLGPIELEELRWYLEEYVIWPGGYVDERARKIEQQLIDWGQMLYREAVPGDSTLEVLKAWSKVDAQAVRRFSVQVDKRLPNGSEETDVELAAEAATVLLSLPWELLHDDDSFLFQGRKAVRVRRRLPNTRDLDIAAVSLPIRVLLVTARPEDDACSYIDHRVSAEPLVRAMENLGGLVELTLLDPPTFSELTAELQRADEVDQPYHVVHFDGHGMFSKQDGLGGLCFEDPEDLGKLSHRRHKAIFTDQLGKELRDYRIPLVFFEACQTAQAEDASGSVASELLKAGVASVVAMSHSVLVETAWRFVETFYQALAEGKRVGDAMLDGQKRLYDESFRLKTFTGDLHLHDWFVPVLFQEEYDPKLFQRLPSESARESTAELREVRLGALPDPPITGFIGRSRQLLALQRLLAREPYAVVQGQGGEGKTALATELARWFVRSNQIERAVFVSVEQLEAAPALAVLDAIGQQLLANYNVAEHAELNEALKLVERALKESSTILIIDNLETLLIPPYLDPDNALAADARADLDSLLDLCRRLNHIGRTKIVFTTREPLPEPFANERHRIELARLDPHDAVAFVERVLREDAAEMPGELSQAKWEVIEDLVESVQGHARTLSLLAPHLQELGVEKTREQVVALMQRMDAAHPDNRERSLFASVELSLQRLSEANRDRVKVLGVFHGGVNPGVLCPMMEWERDTYDQLAMELVGSGLATLGPYGHLRLHPALCPYLHERLDLDERDSLSAHWIEVMRSFVDYLALEKDGDAQLAAKLTLLELPNVMALLDRAHAAGDAEVTVALTNDLFGLVQFLGKPRILAKIDATREAAANALGSTIWSHARFLAQSTRIEQQLNSGQLSDALAGGRDLYQRALAAGDSAYDGADYDVAIACFLLGRVLDIVGASGQALHLLQEAQSRFETIDNAEDSRSARRMASVSLAEQGNSLMSIGQFEAAANAFEEKIKRAESMDDSRQVATGKFQLGTVRYLQGRYGDALSTYEEARDTFTDLGEPLTVATVWHQIGKVYQNAGRAEAAEQAYRQSLTIKTQEGNVAGQANSLLELGNLYVNFLGRLEDAVTFFRQAADKYIAVNDLAREGTARNNLAVVLLRLDRFDEARTEIHRALACKEPFGHASEKWTTWDIANDVETADGNLEAAATARHKALDLFLAYRRDGGENHSVVGRLCHDVTAALLQPDPNDNDTPTIESVKSQMEDLFAEDAGWGPFIPILNQIMDGARHRTLADNAKLSYEMAAEIHVLLDLLGVPEG